MIVGPGALLLALSIQTAAVEAEQPHPGKEAYDRVCAMCHAPTAFVTMMLDMKYRGNPPGDLAYRPHLTPEYIKLVVRQGPPQGGMGPFRPTEISDEELDLVAQYMLKQIVDAKGKPRRMPPMPPGAPGDGPPPGGMPGSGPPPAGGPPPGVAPPSREDPPQRAGDANP